MFERRFRALVITTVGRIVARTFCATQESCWVAAFSSRRRSSLVATQTHAANLSVNRAAFSAESLKHCMPNHELGHDSCHLVLVAVAHAGRKCIPLLRPS